MLEASCVLAEPENRPVFVPSGRVCSTVFGVVPAGIQRITNIKAVMSVYEGFTKHNIIFSLKPKDV